MVIAPVQLDLYSFNTIATLKLVRESVLASSRGNQIKASESSSTSIRTLSKSELEMLEPLLRECIEGNMQEELFSLRAQVASGNVSFFQCKLKNDLRLLAGFFRPTEESDASYQVSFEYIIYSHATSSCRYSVHHKSEAVPILGLNYSPGFCNPRFVALFSENFEWFRQLGANAPTPVFYLIDRFVKRGELYTIPILNHCTPSDSFRLLKDVLAQQGAVAVLTDLYSQWMFLHESGHHDGVLPIPAYQLAKGTRLAGSLEEMRADMSALVRLITHYRGDQSAQILKQCILAERLLRYPVQAILQSSLDSDRIVLDYDSIGSQLSLKFLMELGGVVIRKGQLALTDKIDDSIIQFAAILARVEEDAKASMEKNGGETKEGHLAARHVLEQFVERNVPIDITDIDPERPRFRSVMIYQVYRDMASKLIDASIAVNRKPK